MYPLILDWDRLKNVSTFSVMNGGITGEGQVLLLLLYQKLDTTLSYTDTRHYHVIHRYWTLPCHTQVIDTTLSSQILDTTLSYIDTRPTLSSKILDTTLSNTDTIHYPVITDTRQYPVITDTIHYPVKHRYYILPCHKQILYTTLSYTDTRHYPVIHRYYTLPCHTQIL